MLATAGFGGVTQQPLTIMNRHVHPGTWAHGIARLMAAFARAGGEIDADGAARWLASLGRAAEQAATWSRWWLSSPRPRGCLDVRWGWRGRG
jgi:hypothetical protein